MAGEPSPAERPPDCLNQPGRPARSVVSGSRDLAGTTLTLCRTRRLPFPLIVDDSPTAARPSGWYVVQVSRRRSTSQLVASSCIRAVAPGSVDLGRLGVLRPWQHLALAVEHARIGRVEVAQQLRGNAQPRAMTRELSGVERASLITSAHSRCDVALRPL